MHRWIKTKAVPAAMETASAARRRVRVRVQTGPLRTSNDPGRIGQRTSKYGRRANGEAVIVMAASYSDEVAAILKRDYDQQLHVAILRETGLEVEAA